MKVEIIAVGTELLMGMTVNSNAAWLGKALLSLGLGTYYHQVVGDNPQRMKEAIDLAASRSDIIILTGGLGPTRDDVTKEVLADYLGEDLETDPDQIRRIQDYYQKKQAEATDLDCKQAQKISGSISLPNEVGLSLGGIYQRGQQYFLVLPGPPFELEAMVEAYVLPFFREALSDQGYIQSKLVHFYGIGEAKVASVLDPLIQDQSNPSLAIYANPQEVTLRLTADGDSQADLDDLLAKSLDQVTDLLGPYIIGLDGEKDMAKDVVNRLQAKGKDLVLAESMTGGLLASRIVAIPGASQIFKGSYVSYQSQAKVDFLDLDPGLIRAKGVVSEEVAQAMADQALRLSGTDFSLSVTGVAGPDRLDKHPVGTVFIALGFKGQPSRVQQIQLGCRPRNILREMACNAALNILRKALV